TEDATASTPGGTAQGRAALIAQAQRNHAVPTQHLITNCVIDLDGDDARIGANLLVTFAREELDQQGERYAFTARRTGDGWRLNSVRVEPIWRVSSPR